MFSNNIAYNVVKYVIVSNAALQLQFRFRIFLQCLLLEMQYL